MLEQFRNYIPVEAFTRERVEQQELIPEPQIGLRWGNQSQFVYDTPQEAEQKRKNSRGGWRSITRWDLLFGETRREISVTNFTPVWYKYEVIRIYLERLHEDGSVDIDFENYYDIEHIYRMLVPVDSHTLKFINRRRGSQVGFINLPHNDYLDIRFDRLRGHLLREEEEGEWPTTFEYTEDVWPFATKIGRLFAGRY